MEDRRSVGEKKRKKGARRGEGEEVRICGDMWVVPLESRGARGPRRDETGDK